jgi:hypothetical protein
MPVRVIKQSPRFALVRGTKCVIQRAIFDRSKAYSRFNCLDMSGQANLLASGAKAFHQGNGLWHLIGYTSADVLASIEHMKTPWSPAVSRTARSA